LGLVFELMDMNLYEFIKDRKQFLPEGKVKGFMFQVMKALQHMHSHNIFHRDIKPENILISGEIAKLADFGSCKGMKGTLPCTEYISTRWYRPPECLMTDGYYDYKMDVWGAGCVFFEVLALYPLFQGTNELDQVHKIHDVLGTPEPAVFAEFQSKATHMKFDFPSKTGTGIDSLIPHVSSMCRDLIRKMVAYKACDRISAKEVLKHPYFEGWEKGENAGIRVDSTLNSSSEMSKGFTVLPAIKNSFVKKKKEKDKREVTNKTIFLMENSPYSVKKSILALRKAYAPPEKKFYKSLF
jgi:renal tumor antigen